MNILEPKNQSDNPLVSAFKQALFAELYSYCLFEKETRDYYLFKPHETGDSAWLIPSRSEGQTCEARRFTDEVKRPPQPRIIPAILPFEHYVSFDRLMFEDGVQDIKDRVRQGGSDLAKEVNRCFINVLMTSVSDSAVQIQDDRLENFLARAADELTGRGFNADRFLFPKCLKNRLLLGLINRDDDIDSTHCVGRTNTGLRAFWSAEIPDNMALVFDSTAGVVIAQEPRFWCGEGRRAFHVEVGGLLKTNLILKNLQAVIPIAMADPELAKPQPAVTHLRPKQEDTTELLERLMRLLAEDPTLAARLAAITGDGNVVGDHSVATVTKQSAGDYAIQIGQLNLTLSTDQLRSLLVSGVTPSPLPASSTELPWEPETILIPAGEFLMGSDPAKDRHADDNELPQHTLCLPDYYIAKTPVTNAQYAAFVQATGHDPPGYWTHGKPPKGLEDHPVVYISWYDAVAYCNWLSQVTDDPYRLPSEAEWEKAARGTNGSIYPWSNESPRHDRLNFGGYVGHTTPVGEYSPQGDSPYRATDMSGNVWEWTRSLWGVNWQEPDFGYPYDPTDGREALYAPVHFYRVLRGGGYKAGEEYVRCAARDREHPGYSDEYVGFRVVLAIEAERETDSEEALERAGPPPEA